MPKKFKFRYVNEIVGGFVLLVVLLLLAGVLVAGHAQHWFESVYEINLNFPPEGSMDLQKGGEVMLLGAKVGSVQDITVGDDGDITGSIRVRGPFAKRFVRADSIALVKRKMVVTGDAYIELTRGTGAELPRSGGEIECVKDTEIMQMLEEALEQLRQEATNTLALVNAAISEYTKLAAGMNDPQGNLQLTMANVNGLLEDIRKGPGLPAKILNDPAMAKDVEGIMAQVQELLQKVNAMAAELQVVVAKLPAMVDTVAGEVDNLPVVVGETQTLMRESITLLDGLQKHWLLRKYVESDDALRSEEVLVP
ncbi:MAG: MCE family protein [Kiritimatiellae bacterium]|jgi:phospholipid/cholesterol/gamma-HCH transport system substrate-binding protein|nr:MCE family protein [Kiritimatiellia bacterium]NLD90383.1 MCE family protein [Lentisphaerota bacterium]HOU20786.1 MlaD family protein [Kiritimatiellia bacterium]HPC19461.1 MlaD family protein [Kiritimatiellia bacterium]HQN79796.1 MlaD family protein [Kiritimatiellia bacterium]